MRKANERVLDSGIYARLKSVQMSAADRQNAKTALLRAEQLADAVLWLKKKIADVGQAFLKPSLRA
jgi:hypothetical protein